MSSSGQMQVDLLGHAFKRAVQELGVKNTVRSSVTVIRLFTYLPFNTPNLPFSCLLQLPAYLSFALTSMGRALLQEAREDALDKQEASIFSNETAPWKDSRATTPKLLTETERAQPCAAHHCTTAGEALNLLLCLDASARL